MDIASIAVTFVEALAARLQTAAAAKMLRMNADASADVAKLLEAAQQNFNRLANVAGGIGGNLDIAA